MCSVHSDACCSVCDLKRVLISFARIIDSHHTVPTAARSTRRYSYREQPTLSTVVCAARCSNRRFTATHSADAKGHVSAVSPAYSSISEHGNMPSRAHDDDNVDNDGGVGSGVGDADGISAVACVGELKSE